MRRNSMFVLTLCLLLPLAAGCETTKEKAADQAETGAEVKGMPHLQRIDKPDQDGKWCHAKVTLSQKLDKVATNSVLCLECEGDDCQVRDGRAMVANVGGEAFEVKLKVVDPDPGCADGHTKGVTKYSWNDVQ